MVNRGLLVVDAFSFFILSKPHRTVGVTEKFYLERVRHSPTRILCLWVKFPQLVQGIQLRVGIRSANWQVPGKEHRGLEISTVALISGK